MTILIVDDTTTIRDLLIAYLTDDGYAVTGAASGFEALHCLRTQSFRLVILDVMMPIMDGWQMLRAMRADPVLAAIPVIMMTAGADLRKIAREYGASGYLPKPIDLDALVDIVRYHIG